MNERAGVPKAVENRWTDLIADTEATAAEYEAAGYETLAVHPGDVVVLHDDLAVDVLAPGDEYERATELASEASVDEFDVYTAQEGGVAFALVAALDHERSTAVCVPIYVKLSEADELMEAATSEGYVDLHVRPLSNDSRVAFTLEEPTLLFE